MIEDNNTWYLGIVGRGTSYRLAKYADIEMNNLTSNTTIAKVGMLRLGELMSGQFNRYENNVNFWLITPYSSYYALAVGNVGSAANTGSLGFFWYQTCLKFKIRCHYNWRRWNFTKSI